MLAYLDDRFLWRLIFEKVHLSFLAHRTAGEEVEIGTEGKI